jgi:phage-related protein
MKDVEFLGTSLEAVRASPSEARREVGFEIERLQNGLEPDSWKPMKTISKGVRELRVRLVLHEAMQRSAQPQLRNFVMNTIA